MRLYRLLTGTDDAAFCKKVTEALNKGWELSGPPSLTYNSSRNHVVCGQAVVKDVTGQWTDEMKRDDFKLGEQ